KLPELAWLAFAGNPFCAERDPHSNFRKVSIADLDLGEPLGRGASGVISRATWQFNRYDLDSEVAVKVFHGDITSDGYPEDELDACLSVPEHPNLVGALARIQESESSGLVMRLIPADYYNLGQPPSLESCTRDVFTQNQSLTQSQADALVQQMTGMVEHLEDAEVCHGDLYAHNTLVAPEGNHLLFGDFGAASKYHHLNDKQKSGIRRIERRSLAYFVEDVQSLVGKSRFD
ncbi:MAG: protein kinase, partial [Oceanobacter sp.]